MNVRAGVVNEDARLDVPVRIDVAVATSAGDAAVHLVSVILEIHQPDRFAALVSSDIADPANHVFALRRRRHQVHVRIISDRHIVEIPAELDAFADQEVQKNVRTPNVRRDQSS